MNLCPICSSNKIELQKVTEVFEYKGQRKEFKNYEIFKCNTCEEEFVNEDYFKTIKKEIRDFHHEVDGLLTSQEIKKIRISLGYNQEDFGNLLGGGKKAFARYENGSVSQSKPMNNLLKVLDKMPEALDVIQETNKSEEFIFKGNSFPYIVCDGLSSYNIDYYNTNKVG